MKKKIILGVCFILLISVVLFISPYNPFHYFNAENKINSTFADPAIRGEGLGEDSEITNVKYLGNYIYRVETMESVYLLEINETNSFRNIEVFEHKQRIGHTLGY